VNALRGGGGVYKVQKLKKMDFLKIQAAMDVKIQVVSIFISLCATDVNV